MRKLLSAVILCALVFAIACKKDAAGNYYMQADINGVNESFNNNVFAQEYSGDITAAFSVSGSNAALHHRLLISVGHTYNRKVTTGTYDKTSVDSLFFPGLSFTINDTTVYGSGVRPENPYPVSITINALTNTTVSGTFNGIVYSPGNPADSMLITNGKFYVPLKQ